MGCPTGCNATYPLTGVVLADYTSDGRHFDGVNVIFGDGHVKWVKVGTVYNEAQKFAAGAYSKTTSSAWNPLADNS